ncbi:hypothetical protein PUG46_14420 [Erwiniaceae bacterium L1_55_4]|nr:hypothetical protein [Erwiniaceae bacterium L1_55_4]
MQNREAAKYVAKTMLAVVETITTSVEHIDAMKQEGKVSAEEAELYCQNVMDPLDKMLVANLTTIFERYPDLRPKCPCADSQQGEA